MCMILCSWFIKCTTGLSQPMRPRDAEFACRWDWKLFGASLASCQVMWIILRPVYFRQPDNGCLHWILLFVFVCIPQGWFCHSQNKSRISTNRLLNFFFFSFCNIFKTWPASDNVDVMKTDLIIVSSGGSFFLVPSSSARCRMGKNLPTVNGDLVHIAHDNHYECNIRLETRFQFHLHPPGLEGGR